MFNVSSSPACRVFFFREQIGDANSSLCDSGENALVLFWHHARLIAQYIPPSFHWPFQCLSLFLTSLPPLPSPTSSPRHFTPPLPPPLPPHSRQSDLTFNKNPRDSLMHTDGGCFTWKRIIPIAPLWRFFPLKSFSFIRICVSVWGPAVSSPRPYYIILYDFLQEDALS